MHPRVPQAPGAFKDGSRLGSGPHSPGPRRCVPTKTFARSLAVAQGAARPPGTGARDRCRSTSYRHRRVRRRVRQQRWSHGSLSNHLTTRGLAQGTTIAEWRTCGAPLRVGPFNIQTDEKSPLRPISGPPARSRGPLVHFFAGRLYRRWAGSGEGVNWKRCGGSMTLQGVNPHRDHRGHLCVSSSSAALAHTYHIPMRVWGFIRTAP
jgi:hypothetical protein